MYTALDTRNVTSIFELSPDEQRVYADYARQAAELAIKQLAYLRHCLRRKGVIGKLSSLKTKKGEPFQAENSMHRDQGYRRATGGNGEDWEAAYLCKTRLEGRGCNWVKGEPIVNGYDEALDPTEIASKRIFCRICGRELKVFFRQ